MRIPANQLRITSGSVFSVLVLLAGLPARAQAQFPPGSGGSFPEGIHETKRGVSPPLRDLPVLPSIPGPPQVIPLRPVPQKPTGGETDASTVQTSATAATPAPSTDSFNGLGQGNYGFTVQYLPPDTNGAVGDTQYVQWVNASYAVFGKSGGLLKGPVAGNALWQSFSITDPNDGCAKYNDGDPIVQFDKINGISGINGRWVLTQPVFHTSNSANAYLVCVAVSQTSDATGSYNLYEYALDYFPDFPKLGVWPDAYYMSFNLFSGPFFVGPFVCALNRANMRAGLPTGDQPCKLLSTSYHSLLPSDVDGTTSPPSGSPNSFVNLGSNALNLWTVQPNFSSVPPTLTVTGPTPLSVAAFSPACGGGACIPQSETNQKLDSLGDRLNYRLAYRNFPNDPTPHESLVVSHAVKVGSGRGAYAGIRWYELRKSGTGNWSVFQQGTYAPNTNFRWMGSIAMDKKGNVAVGYSVSSAKMHPSIAYAGREVTDTTLGLGKLGGEQSAIVGSGSQLPYPNGAGTRWGDYSSMTVDPGDDCTFFYTTEYLPANGDFNWRTWITKFKFLSCTSP